ncbi:MAG: NADH-quinone oxidoreductase subunit I [Candidatus Bathyarchaeia archaeon]|jgi:formate hydrogenlyase subunit 6/NADH:ubiquinone oxidoreductase subunit I
MILSEMYEGVKTMFKHTLTMKYPYQKLQLPKGFRGRHQLYMAKCTGCGICAWICPEKCITLVPPTEKKEYPQNPEGRFPQYWYARCCFCHFCTDYCPTGALDYTPDYELAEYDRDLLLWSPERLSRPATNIGEYHSVFHGDKGSTGVTYEPVNKDQKAK